MEVRMSWRERDMKEGFEQGRQEGRLEGRQEGRQEGMFSLIARQIARRFGESVNPEIRDQIGQLSAEQLEMLADALLGFADVDDLANWLKALEC